MKKRACILFYIFVFCSWNIFSQKNSKIILNSKTKWPIDYVYINSENSKFDLLTNKDGKFILISDPKIKTLSFYKMGYYPKKIRVEELIKTDTIYLDEQPIELAQVEIKLNIIDTIVKDKRFYLDDYLVLPNQDFLIITSKINIPGFEISYYKWHKGVTCTKKIKNEGSGSIFKDCFNNAHVVTKDYSRQIFFESDSTFNFLPKYSRSRFDSTLAKVVLRVDTTVVISSSQAPVKIKQQYFDLKKNSPFLSYIMVSKNSRKNVYTVMYNKELREMLKYEIYDSESMAAEAKALGGSGDSEVKREAKMDLFFTKIAAPIYAPVFLKNDTIVIFNFQENLIVFLNKSGQIIKEVDLDHKELSTFRNFEIIYDAPGQRFYFKTKDSDRSTLSLLNIYSGKIAKKIHLEKVFAKNIQIVNGKIYYIVKEKEWDDTSYLYQQN